MTEPGGTPEFARIRLHVDSSLGAGLEVPLSEGQGHYLRTVMRLKEGAAVRLFNGRDGEWSATLTGLGRKGVIAVVRARLRAQDTPADIEVLFAPIKKTPMAYLTEKATELGAARLRPVLTVRTQVRALNLERLQAHAAEAAEQSFRMSVPEIAEPAPLAEVLRAWPGRRGLIFCDEGGAMAGTARPALEVLGEAKDRFSAWSILIGPEGGFSPGEQALIRERCEAIAISLGPRILRAETACVTALTLVQAVMGDLNLTPA